MKKILDYINSTKDLKKLNNSELNILADEIRKYIIDTVSKNGGHLASNLGVVELTIALHRVFNLPKDKIVWDVGHQSYAHKIITNRREKFKTIRQFGGLSGFPKRNESDCDVFETGHSSTSISSALGIAKARDLAGEDNSVIAVIGDGALTGGMAFEALNYAGDFPTNLIVVLNDNTMSISKNVGGLSNYLSRIRTEPAYYKFKEELGDVLNNIPLLGKILFKSAEKIRNWLKYLLVPGVLFEELGLKYLGPIDGHDVTKLEEVLSRAKDYNGYPVLIHVITNKGQGYDFAMKKPDKFHGIGPFEVSSGEVVSKSNKRSYSNIFGNSIIKLAEKNNKIVAVSAAMPEGTGLNDFSKKYKDRFFDVGIAEQHAVTFCAGLAVGGLKPIFAVYSTFLQRAYDQIVHDVCMQNLPVIFAIDRAGIVGADGETHHGVFDISYLSHIPNITIMSPKDGFELESMLELAVELNSPVAIRYPRGKEGDFSESKKAICYGKSETLLEGCDGVIIAEGRMVETAYAVCKKLITNGLKYTLINMRFIKPLDKELLEKISKSFDKIYTLEDNVLSGGMSSKILEFYNEKDIKVKLKVFAYPDKYITHGQISELYAIQGMDEESIYKSIIKDI